MKPIYPSKRLGKKFKYQGLLLCDIPVRNHRWVCPPIAGPSPQKPVIPMYRCGLQCTVSVVSGLDRYILSFPAPGLVPLRISLRGEPPNGSAALRSGSVLRIDLDRVDQPVGLGKRLRVAGDIFVASGREAATGWVLVPDISGP